MKSLWLVSLATSVCLSSFAAQEIAKGQIDLSTALASKAKGIRTLFVSVYDPKSAMPMPIAAYKADLKKDASGKFYDLNLTEANVMRMAQGQLPPVVNLKAKLDRDGSAGPDSPGDLVGWAKDVKLGAKNVKITIDREVH